LPGANGEVVTQTGPGGEITLRFVAGELLAGSDPGIGGWSAGAIITPDNCFRAVPSVSLGDPERQRIPGWNFSF
jgi:hypothetical protein